MVFLPVVRSLSNRSLPGVETIRDRHGGLGMVRTSRAAKVAWMVAWLIVFYLVARVVSAHAGEVPPAEAQAFQQVFQKVAPSVVAIRAQGLYARSGSQTRLVLSAPGVIASRPCARLATTDGAS